MAYVDFKDLARRTDSNKVLTNKTFKIAKNPKYDGYQRGLASMIYKFFDKKSSGSGITTIKPNYQLANELHKPIIRKFKKRKAYSSFRDNIWGVDLADMQSLSKYNRGIRYLLCVIDLFSKYVWVIPLKDKKGTSKKENFLFFICNLLGLKLLTRLRLQLSHLNEPKFRHGFGDTISPMCGCSAEIESTEHFLLRCQFHSSQRLELFNNLNKIIFSFFKLIAKDSRFWYALIHQITQFL